MRCCQWYLVLGLGLGIAATGAIFTYTWRDIFNILATEEKSLMPGTAAYKEWRRPTVHPSWQFYLFNWTNAANVLDHASTSPIFRELGPFTYDEHAEVVDTKYHASNGTLTYRKRTYFRRHPGDLSALLNITSVNFPALLISFLSRTVDYSMQRELSFVLHDLGQSVTSTWPVGQLLFGGYRGQMWDQAQTIVCPRHHIAVLCNEERLAYFRMFNFTRKASDRYSLNMGRADRALYGLIRSWYPTSGNSELGTCGQFEGYSGELFPSLIDRSKMFTIVLPELCLRLLLEYEREVTVGDVVGYRYVAKLFEALHGGATCPETTANRPGYGTISSSDCHRTPLYRSSAAQPYGGLELSQSDIYFVLEPITGTVLESHISLQYHTTLRPNPHIALFQDVPELTVPLFRFVRHYRLSDFNVRSLTRMLRTLDMGYQLALAGSALGVGIVVLASIYGCWGGRKPDNKDLPRKLHAEYRIVVTRPGGGERIE